MVKVCFAMFWLGLELGWIWAKPFPMFLLDLIGANDLGILARHDFSRYVGEASWDLFISKFYNSRVPDRPRFLDHNLILAIWWASPASLRPRHVQKFRF